MRAAVRGSVDCAAAILEHGGSTEPENYYGKAAAQLARENGCQPVYQLIGQVGYRWVGGRGVMCLNIRENAE